MLTWSWDWITRIQPTKSGSLLSLMSYSGEVLHMRFVAPALQMGTCWSKLNTEFCCPMINPRFHKYVLIGITWKTVNISRKCSTECFSAASFMKREVLLPVALQSYNAAGAQRSRWYPLLHPLGLATDVQFISRHGGTLSPVRRLSICVGELTYYPNVKVPPLQSIRSTSNQAASGRRSKSLRTGNPRTMELWACHLSILMSSTIGNSMNAQGVTVLPQRMLRWPYALPSYDPFLYYISKFRSTERLNSNQSSECGQRRTWSRCCRILRSNWRHISVAVYVYICTLLLNFEDLARQALFSRISFWSQLFYVT